MAVDKPNILMVFPCSWRRDRLDVMPKLGKLVRTDGWTEWARHYGVAHCSDPNYLSLLTGGHPDDHGVHAQMGAKFDKQFPTLQKQLGRAGYYTWAYEPLRVAHFYRDGFQDMVTHLTWEVSKLMAPGPKACIKSAGSRPWFGFMRMMDVHYPYNGEDLQKWNEDVLNRQYNKAAAHLDRFIQHLVRWVLREHPNTVIIIGSDHGELLGEHGLWDHLFTLKNPLVHVPMFAYEPGGGLSRVRNDLTQHTDVYGLVAEATGIKEAQGAPKVDGLWLSAWGVGHRDAWKHKSLVADLDGTTLQYTVNWHVEHGASFELHKGDDYATNYFGHDEISMGMSVAMAEKYPTFPRPDFGRPRSELTRGAHLMRYDAVALGDAQLVGDGMVDEHGRSTTEVCLRPTTR